MRRLVLIATILLVSASAHAGTTRGLTTLASTDTTQQAEPAAPAVAAPVQTEAPKAQATTQASPAEAAPASVKPVKKPIVRRETDEQKARRIAARYGISW